MLTRQIILIPVFFFIIVEIESEYMGCFHSDTLMANAQMNLVEPNRTMSVCKSVCKHGGFRYAGQYYVSVCVNMVDSDMQVSTMCV